MDLILWRHADAEEADGTPDLERRLSAHGERQAARIASRLNRQLPDSAHILVSPAERAQRTALKLESKFKTVTEIGPLATAEQVFSTAGWPTPGRSIVVVGRPIPALAAPQHWR